MEQRSLALLHFSALYRLQDKKGATQCMLYNILDQMYVSDILI